MGRIPVLGIHIDLPNRTCVVVTGKSCMTLTTGKHTIGFILAIILEWQVMKIKLKPAETAPLYRKLLIKYQDEAFGYTCRMDGGGCDVGSIPFKDWAVARRLKSKNAFRLPNRNHKGELIDIPFEKIIGWTDLPDTDADESLHL